jgi:hypothetical protein
LARAFPGWSAPAGEQRVTVRVNALSSVPGLRRVGHFDTRACRSAQRAEVRHRLLVDVTGARNAYAPHQGKTGIADCIRIANRTGMKGHLFAISVVAPRMPVDFHGLVAVVSSSHSASARKAWAVLM